MTIGRKKTTIGSLALCAALLIAAAVLHPMPPTEALAMEDEERSAEVPAAPDELPDIADVPFKLTAAGQDGNARGSALLAAGASRALTTFWVTNASGGTDVYTGTWTEGTGANAGKWWIQYSDGTYPKSCWVYDTSKGKYCYLNSSGYAYANTIKVLPYSNATADADNMFAFGFDSQCYAVTGSFTFDGTKYGFSRKYTTNAEAKKHPNGELYTGGQGDEKGYWGPINEAGVYGKNANYGLSLAMYAKLTFDANGGSGGGAVYRFSEAPLTKLPTAATRTGYTFKGWYTAKTGGTKLTTSTKGPRQATTYYAQWTANTYTVAYAGMAGASHGASHPASGTYDAAFSVSNPTRTGYTFAGWKITGMDSVTHTYGTSTTTATSIASTKETSFKNLRSTAGTVTFTALWEPNVYTISLDAQKATSAGSTAVYEKHGTGIFKESGCTTQITASANPITKPARAYSVTYDYNGSGAAQTKVTAAYTFGGYYTAVNGGGTQRINADGTLGTFPATAYTAPATLYAKWTGGSVVLPTPTRNGYAFKGWNTAANGSGTGYAGGTSFTPTADTTLYAQWAIENISFTVPSEINLTVNADGTLNAPTEGMYLDNESDFAIEVNALQVVPAKGWDLVSPGEEVGRTDTAALRMGPQGHEVDASRFTAKQALDATAGWKMERNGSAGNADRLQFGIAGSISSVDNGLLEKTQIASIRWFVQSAS